MTCDHAASGAEVRWVGYTKRALQRLRPAKDVQECGVCGETWYYARTGRRIRVITFTREGKDGGR